MGEGERGAMNTIAREGNHVRTLLITMTIASALVSMSAGLARAAESGAATHKPGSGYRLFEDESGSVNFKAWAYARYLNQKGLDDTYTDSFGTVKSVDIRQDIQFNKAILYFYGWFMDPRFRYLTYVWTTNTSQGQGAQVVLAGNLSYRFSNYLTLFAGIGGLPGVRSTSYNFPFWLGVDQRLIADEFFRPSYTSGIWAEGTLAKGVTYIVMLGDNLSQLGVDAAQMDNTLDTWSGALVWMPTTGEFGSGRGGFGDFEAHEKLATRVGAHFTYSTENRQSQPGTEDPENSQIRISDGNVVFTPGLFGAGVNVIDVAYHMFAVDAGVKYHGFSLEGEIYSRWVNNIRGDNVDQLTFDELKDHGFQLQASAMVKPQTVQVYVSTSKILGEYGDPWDARVGVNWYPWDNQCVRWNNEFIRLEHSPVGALSLPYVVGGNGLVFHSNFEVNF